MTDCPHICCRGICMSHRDTDTSCLNKRPKLDNLTLKPSFDVSMSSLCLFYDVSHLFVLPGFFLQACVFQHATDSPYSSARQVGVVFWSPRGSGGPSDAASRSPRVKGENSENRALWSAREDLPALFCMLEFGQGVTRGWRGVRIGEKEREMREKD